VSDGLVIAVNQNPALANVYTTYGAETPQVYLRLGRERAEILGLSITTSSAHCRPTIGLSVSEKLTERPETRPSESSFG